MKWFLFGLILTLGGCFSGKLIVIPNCETNTSGNGLKIEPCYIPLTYKAGKVVYKSWSDRLEWFYTEPYFK